MIETTVRTRRLAGITALGAIAALSLSACGSTAPQSEGTQPASAEQAATPDKVEVPKLEEIWPEVRENLQKATSVKIKGVLEQDGKDMSVDMAGQVDDSSYAGKITMEDFSMELIGDKTNTYIKPDAAFWEKQGGAAIGDMVGDKWIDSGQAADTSMSTFYKSFSEEAPEAEEFKGTTYTSEEVDHNGQKVFKYTGKDDDTGQPIVMLISQDKQLIRLETQEKGTDDKTSPSTIDFSEWNTVKPFEMPSKDEIADIPGM